MKKIKVLIIDDSALVRQVLTSMLSVDSNIEVVGTAGDPIIAKQKMKTLNPDVLTLDVEMPRMDGLTFLEKLMDEDPISVVMVSSLTEKGCETTMRALELGAIDFVTKPKIDLRNELSGQGAELIEKIKAAAAVKVSNIKKANISSHQKPMAMIKTTDTIIAIGASTGGTEAIKQVLINMPLNSPPIIITQHMPAGFTKSFAKSLDTLCQINVKEASDGDSVLPGLALIAPGNYHMELKRSGARYSASLNQHAPVNLHRPSVDVMFNSVAKIAGANSVGVILTGMGTDGAIGIKAINSLGAYTIAQDESTCVVFGMPRAAIEIGGIDSIKPIPKIASEILDHITCKQ